MSNYKNRVTKKKGVKLEPCIDEFEENGNVGLNLKLLQNDSKYISYFRNKGSRKHIKKKTVHLQRYGT